MAGNFFRGTSVEQDGRWGKSDQKLMAKMSKNGMFSAILDTKVNVKKINLDVINKWITQKIIEIVGFEDDILINLVINMLQGDEVDAKKMQLDVTGFLEKQAQSFVEELWTLLVDAQGQPSGIPSVFIQKKKEEILSRQGQSKRWGPSGSSEEAAAPYPMAPPIGSLVPQAAKSSAKSDVDTKHNRDHVPTADRERGEAKDGRDQDQDRDRRNGNGNGSGNGDSRRDGRDTRGRDRDGKRDDSRDKTSHRDRDRDSRRDRDGERDRRRDDSRDRSSHRRSDRDGDRDRDRDSRRSDRDGTRDRDRDRDRDGNRDRGSRKDRDTDEDKNKDRTRKQDADSTETASRGNDGINDASPADASSFQRQKRSGSSSPSPPRKRKLSA
jgi:serine/arginine repetitive matrix protein 1